MPSPSNSNQPNPSPAEDQNELRLHELRSDVSFYEAHKDEYVAISGGLMVDHAADQQELMDRLSEEQRSQQVLIAPLDPSRTLNINFRMRPDIDSE